MNKANKQQEDLNNSNMDNHKMLQLIGMTQEEVEKEAKLGLKLQKKEQQIEKFKNAEKIHIDEAFKEVDYVQMDQHQLVNFYPFIEKKDEKEYIQFQLKPIPRLPVNQDDLIQISSLEPWVQKAFDGCKTLNRIQSKVFAAAFQNDENMLICAPTGAGKTNVALLTILNEIAKRIDKDSLMLQPDKAEFKIIYISPMKALAAEIVEKFQTKLRYMGIVVRELTGDMQLTKQEIQETHVIITTPEKWDVVTRKSDGMTGALKLIIIDEIHLLNDERGPVLESLVARTLRSIERLQSFVRLVGLSATLPNYLDVASFLQVKKEEVFYFDSTYRPVPLEQIFIGVKDLPQNPNRKLRRTKRDIYNDLCYYQTRTQMNNQKQVMIFVHSRKETLSTAMMLLEKANEIGEDYIFSPASNNRGICEKLKHKPLRMICPKGIGIHNAGLLRKDRSLIEKMFLDGQLRVLVTTATLAWGVNLPAYCVIIKGTDVYEPTKGTTNLSVLDVQQIFGRAGRPQFDTQGMAVLMTDFNKVSQYIGQLNNASYIESHFLSFLKESINAEICLGNITSIFEAMEWMNFTFLNIRIRRNPLAYGLRLQSGMDKSLQIEMFINEKIDSILQCKKNIILK